MFQRMGRDWNVLVCLFSIRESWGIFFFFSNLKFKRRVKSMLLRERERDAYEAFKRKGKDLFDAREIGVLQI